MPTINELTADEFKTLLNEYFAKPEERSKMSVDEIKELAQKLNEKINVPIVRETGEEKILIKVIIKIDQFLYDNLPNEFYGLVRDVNKGIDDAEAKRLIKRLSKLANEHINIPYMPEAMEYTAIRFVMGVIINSARKGWDLSMTKKDALRMNVPINETPSNQELEEILF